MIFFALEKTLSCSGSIKSCGNTAGIDPISIITRSSHLLGLSVPLWSSQVAELSMSVGGSGSESLGTTVIQLFHVYLSELPSLI